MTSENSKTPTWQWVAGLALSALMFSSSVLLLETRADIKEVRQANVAISERVKVIETGIPLQFEAIKAWRDEIRVSLDRLSTGQQAAIDAIAKRDRSAAAVKKWNEYK